MYRRMLAIHERQLGAGHPLTASSLNNLAILYNVQEKYGEAESLFQQALAIREQVLGPSHPDTALSVWWLACACERQQQYEKAKSLYRRALEVYEGVFGADHPDTQAIRANYTVLLSKLEADGTSGQTHLNFA